jgi:hypothetical protein
MSIATFCEETPTDVRKSADFDFLNNLPEVVDEEQARAV